jgi:hypothetical protein
MTRGVAAAAALAVAAAAVTVGAVACNPDARQLAIEVGVVGGVVLAGALFWRPVLLTPALIALAIPAALTLDHRSGTAGVVVPAAALLVATGELAGWSFDRRSVVPEGAGATANRALTTAALTGGSGLVAASVLTLSALPAPSGPVPVLAGAGAALAVVALAALRRW